MTTLLQRTTLATLLGLSLSLIAIKPVLAEAPVYDADAMPQQQFDNSQESQQEDLPPPPAPGQEGMSYNSSMSNGGNGGSGGGVDQRLKKVEKQVGALQSDSSAARVQSLQSEVQSLRGQVEQLTHQLQQIQAQQKSMYTDLDKRVGQKSSDNNVSATAPAEADEAATAVPEKPARKTVAAIKPVEKVEKTPVNAPPAAAMTDSAKSSAPQPNVAEEQQIYQTAYDLIKAKKYSEAVNALQGMLKRYPSGQFASNAHYWLGELYGLMGKSDQALAEFNIVVKNYPSSPRLSDAQLKVGLIYASQLKWPEAKLAFKNVITHFPGTASSRLAAEQIRQIKDAGH